MFKKVLAIIAAISLFGGTIAVAEEAIVNRMEFRQLGMIEMFDGDKFLTNGHYRDSINDCIDKDPSVIITERMDEDMCLFTLTLYGVLPIASIADECVDNPTIVGDHGLDWGVYIVCDEAQLGGFSSSNNKERVESIFYNYVRSEYEGGQRP